MWTILVILQGMVSRSSQTNAVPLHEEFMHGPEATSGDDGDSNSVDTCYTLTMTKFIGGFLDYAARSGCEDCGQTSPHERTPRLSYRLGWDHSGSRHTID